MRESEGEVSRTKGTGDMTESILDNSQKIERLLDELLHREQFYKEKRLRAAEAEHAYRIALAKAFVEAMGSAELRKQTAYLEASQELQDREIANAESEIAYQKLQDVRAALIARQTLAKAERERPI